MDKFKILSLSAVILTFFFGILYGRHSAFATNGAFPYTKHGGGATDGVNPYDAGNGPGVDRSVNPDYGGSYYNNINPEAGKYKGGECTQCHEPHASFGGSEPAPVNGTPDPYLLMRYGTSVTNYAELCWYCHESMNLNGNPTGYGYWGFYQGKNVYQASSHYNPPAGSFYWPGTSGDPVNIWPRKNRSGLPTGNLGSCLNCHTPHGIKSPDATGAFDTTSPDGTGGAPASRQTVASGNPSVTADYLIPRQLIAWEETLCERCHDASGPSTKNIQDEINKRATGSGHPVDDTTLAGRHVASESLPITTKHVECYDCHNPHAVKAPTGVLGDGDGGRVKGMKYVDINGTVQNPATGAPQPYVYQVCFKCHGNSFDCIMPYKALGASDGTAGCTPLATKNRGNESGAGNNDQRGASNKRVEFNPNTVIGATHGADATKTNGAYHPVYQPGRNGSIQLCNQLQSAFGLNCTSQAAATAALSSLTINCTDCHNNNDTGASTIRGPVTGSNLRTTDKNSVYGGTSPVGPHGSTNPRILRAGYNTYISPTSPFSYNHEWGGSGSITTAMDTNFALCFLCHDSTPFKTRFPGSQWTNFYGVGSGNWSGSLHWYHLSITWSGQTTNDAIKCHECHNNVHSNVEANNTQYYSGASCCTGFTADGNTHLLNFGPQASPDSYAKPAWFYNSGWAWGWGGGTGIFNCNLRCHGKTMSSCEYLGAFDGGPGGGGWC